MPDASLERDEDKAPPAPPPPPPPAAGAVAFGSTAQPLGQAVPPPPGRGTPLRREALWAAAAAASYGATLFIGSDDYMILAIPGMLGLVLLEVVAVRYVLRRPSRGSQASYATDGSDHRGAVHFLYAALVKRYILLVLCSLAVMAVPLVTRATYSIPLMGVGLLGVILATVYWFDQLRWVRQCARVLSVYDFEFRAPVEKLELWRGGRRFLVLGVEEDASPEMLAREPMGHPHWPKRIGDGVWFAGDDAFGGALLVPGTGELMCMQPLAWDALEGWRNEVGAERMAKAKRAGLDRHSV